MLPLHTLIDLPPGMFNSLHQHAPLSQLNSHIIDRFLKHHALAPALPFQTGHELCQAIKALADCLAALLFCVCLLVVP
jgi:hypothetical protein